jgi:hypothetical protein
VKVLLAQAIGSACVTAATFGVSLLIMSVINAAGYLRVSREGELEGLDLHEHGISAYPEYVISSAGSLPYKEHNVYAPSAPAAVLSEPAGIEVSSGAH